LAESLYDFFVEALQQIVADIIVLLPNIILAIAIIGIATVAIKLINKLVSRILRLIDLDGLLKKLAKIKLPFGLSNLVILLIDLGIALIALFGIAYLFLGSQQIELLSELFLYGARFISIIIVIIFTLIVFEAIIDRVSTETKMRGYVMFLLLVLITMMIIDLTALSESTKIAIQQGLGIGFGIAIGVFAIWFFFHDYFDKLVLKGNSSEKKSEK
jgi:hypothetical protein